LSSAEDFTYFPKLGRKTEFEHGIEMYSKKSDINDSGRKATENIVFNEISENEDDKANSKAPPSPKESERDGEVKKMGGNRLGLLDLFGATASLLPEENKDVQSEKKGNVQSEIPRDREKVEMPVVGNRLRLLAPVAAVVCLVAIAVIYNFPPERVTKDDFDLAKVFGNSVDQLVLNFTNQTERFWKILKNRGSAHLRDNNPSQPLVLLLAAPPPAHEWVDCLAIKLAEMLGLKQKNNLARIDGADEKGYSGDKIKEKMDVYLKEKFEDGHRVAVIHHLELLPPPSALLFYSYCDDQNAPYKHVAIIFTVHLPFEPRTQEAEGSVNKYLLKEGLLSDDMDKVAALLSHIADTVAVMNGESGDSLKAYCS